MTSGRKKPMHLCGPETGEPNPNHPPEGTDVGPCEACGKPVRIRHVTGGANGYVTGECENDRCPEKTVDNVAVVTALARRFTRTPTTFVHLCTKHVTLAEDILGIPYLRRYSCCSCQLEILVVDLALMPERVLLLDNVPRAPEVTPLQVVDTSTRETHGFTEVETRAGCWQCLPGCSHWTNERFPNCSKCGKSWDRGMKDRSNPRKRPRAPKPQSSPEAPMLPQHLELDSHFSHPSTYRCFCNKGEILHVLLSGTDMRRSYCTACLDEHLPSVLLPLRIFRKKRSV